MKAHIGFVGSSSMEIRIDVFNHEKKLYCSACYVMVARDKKTGKAKKVPQLDFELETDPTLAKMRFLIGKQRQEYRVNKSKNSLFNQPPKTEEMSILHQLFRDQIASGVNGQVGRTTLSDGRKLVPIADTMVSKSTLMHIQDRNVHGKIFGGLLMRESLELAFVCANTQPWLDKPEIYFVDDIYFIKPVDIGSFIRYSAIVTYCEGTLANVKVVVEKVGRENDMVRYDKATEFNMVLRVSKRTAEVVPKTYEEAMMYIEARRRIKRLNEHR